MLRRLEVKGQGEIQCHIRKERDGYMVKQDWIQDSVGVPHFWVKLSFMTLSLISIKANGSFVLTRVIGFFFNNIDSNHRLFYAYLH